MNWSLTRMLAIAAALLATAAGVAFATHGGQRSAGASVSACASGGAGGSGHRACGPLHTPLTGAVEFRTLSGAAAGTARSTAAERKAHGRPSHGVTGPTGPAGPAGPAGPPGPAGPAGPTGETGAVGAAGTQGSAGPVGPSGTDGAPGPAGPTGAKGDTGAAGPSGSPGPAGERGPAGLKGDPGTNGAQGANGAPGPAGPQGIAGTPGTTGPPGVAGPAGAIGPQGPAGPQGASGPAGSTGPAGPAGQKGDPGTALSSLDQLSGTRCQTDGTVRISYDASGTVTLTCAAAAPVGVPSVRINEVETGTTSSAADEFVEMVNAGTAAVDISGWRVVYRSAAGTADTTVATIPAGTTLAAGAFYLLGGSGYAGAAAADQSFSTGLAGTGGATGIRDGSGTLVDSVGWGTATNALVEGSAAAAPPSTAAPGSSIDRIPDGRDTNQNAADFTISATATPRASNH